MRGIIPNKFQVIFTIIFLCCGVKSFSQEYDSLEISLLTCTPGHVAYTMYGHSAIRVNNFTKKTDYVFNYGVFDYTADKFVYRFVKGETDYILAAEYTDGFFSRYKDEKAGVAEQVLNITPSEANRLYALLIENMRPANCTYRYNWLYDNCTTRARDIIEKAIEGEVRYCRHNRQMSAREILHEFNQVDRWMEFGENMVLGAELDRPLTFRQQMFIPSYFMADVDSAEILRTDGTSVPLVRSTRHPLVAYDLAQPQTVDLPMWTFVILLIIVITVSIYELKRRKTFKWIDIILSISVATAGLLVSFLYFFSEHPGVNSNILVILFNPLPLIAIPFLYKRHTTYISYAFLLLFLFFCIAIIAVGQCLDYAIWPLALILLIRVIVNISLNRIKSLSLQNKTKI